MGPGTGDGLNVGLEMREPQGLLWSLSAAVPSNSFTLFWDPGSPRVPPGPGARTQSLLEFPGLPSLCAPPPSPALGHSWPSHRLPGDAPAQQNLQEPREQHKPRGTSPSHPAEQPEGSIPPGRGSRQLLAAAAAQNTFKSTSVPTAVTRQNLKKLRVAENSECSSPLDNSSDHVKENY